MKLVGASFAGVQAASEDFDTVVMEAVRQLNPEGVTKSEAEAQREALIQGYRWILVDEYQDIGPQEYALIAAVAGRTLEDADLKLSLFAVGDDDQNIYAFSGASVEYIRSFEEDYRNQTVVPCGKLPIDGPHHRGLQSRDFHGPAHARPRSPDPDRRRAAEARRRRLEEPIRSPGPGSTSRRARRARWRKATAAIDELSRLSRLGPD